MLDLRIRNLSKTYANGGKALQNVDLTVPFGMYGLLVISTKLMAGRTVARVYSDSAPGAAFESVAPDLEDVYFCTMSGHSTVDAARQTATA